MKCLKVGMLKEGKKSKNIFFIYILFSPTLTLLLMKLEVKKILKLF